MRRLGVLFAALVAVLLLSELVCRMVVSDPLTAAAKGHAAIWRPDGLVADSDVGFAFQPGYSGRMTAEGQFDVPYRINAQGLRNDYEYKPAVEGKARVLLVGDSFVFGVGVTLPQTLGRQLQRLLNAARGTGRAVEVVAIGCPSYGLDAYALLVERWVPRLRPDLVAVCLFAGNDLLDYSARDGNRKVVVDGHLVGERQAWAWGVRKHSRLANLVLGHFNPIARSEGDRSRHPRPADLVAMMRSMQPWLERLAAAPGEGGPPLVVVVLHGRQAVASLVARAPYRPVEPLPAVLKSLGELGVPVLDTKGAWRTVQPPIDRYFFPEDAHYTAFGNAFVAAWLARELRAGYARELDD